jgi:hypothetical protein
MAGRAAEKPKQGAELVAPLAYCRSVGCEQRVRTGRAHCEACEVEQRHRESEAFCREHGLTTIEEKRAYCARMAKRFAPPSFERWAATITQKTVDIIERLSGKDVDRTLERLRAAGAIDGRNKVIPTEARATAAEAYRAERARRICEVEAALAAHRKAEEEFIVEERRAAP